MVAGFITVPKADFFTDAGLLELLRHKSPRVREWAAGRLALRQAGAALDEAIALAASEPHPDVLGQLLDWFVREAGPDSHGALLDLGHRLARSRRPEPAAQLLLALLSTNDDAVLAAALTVLVDESASRELPVLRRLCGCAELYPKLKAYCAAAGEPSPVSVLMRMLPQDQPRQAVHWAFGVGAFCAQGSRQRWDGLRIALPMPRGREEGERQPRDNAAPIWIKALEALAARERDASWECPALAGPRFSAPLEGLRRAGREAAESIEELAHALRWTAPHLSELPEKQDLEAVVDDVLSAGRELETLRGALRRAADPPAAFRTLALLPLRLFEDLSLDLFSGFAEDQARRLLVGLLADDVPPQVQSVAAERLTAMGPSALDSLAACLDSADAPPLLLDVIGRYPGERAGLELARRSHELFQRFPQRDVAAALADTGAEAAIAPLVDAYRPGEPDIARALRLLSELHEQPLPAAKDVYGDLAEAQRREVDAKSRLASADTSDLAQMIADLPLRILLRCRGCRYEHTYLSEHVLVAPDFIKEGKIDSAVSFDRLIRCKRCGAVEDYDLSGETIALLAALLVTDRRLGEAAANEVDDAAPGRVRYVEGLHAGGKVFGCFRDALRHLVEESTRRPDSADVFKRLGNIYNNGGQPDLARQAYSKSLALDADEMEAHFNMGRILMGERDWTGARSHFWRVLALGKHRAFPAEQRRAMVRETVHLLHDLNEDSGLAAFPAPRSGDQAPPAVTIRGVDLESDEDLDRFIDACARTFLA